MAAEETVTRARRSGHCRQPGHPAAPGCVNYSTHAVCAEAFLRSGFRTLIGDPEPIVMAKRQDKDG